MAHTRTITLCQASMARPVRAVTGIQQAAADHIDQPALRQLVAQILTLVADHPAAAATEPGLEGGQAGP